MGKIKISKRRAGMTIIETLVASLILGVALAGMVSTWYFSYGMTVKSDSRGMGYALGRRALERSKETGGGGNPSFSYILPNATSSTTTLYYDVTGGSENSSSKQKGVYTVTTTVNVASPDPAQPATNFIGSGPGGVPIP